MFGSTALEVAIGVAFVYLLLSMICSALNEMIAGWLKLRATGLQEGIRNLLNDRERLSQLYAHPLVKGLGRDGRLPSYLPAKVFTTALVDTLMPADPAALPKTVGDLRKAVGELPNGHLKTALAALIDEAGTDLVAARQAISKWFDDGMERVSGWYRRQAHRILLALAAIVAVGLNVDSVSVSQALARDGALRAAVVASAQQMVERRPEGETAVPVLNFDTVKAELEKLKLPIGWETPPPEWKLTWRALVTKIAGLVVTIIAVSLGAPFWFDLLNKLVNLRSGGPKPATAATDK